MDITKEQWNRIEPIIRELTPAKDPRGRPANDLRQVFNGILTVNWHQHAACGVMSLPTPPQDADPPFAGLDREGDGPTKAV